MCQGLIYFRIGKEQLESQSLAEAWRSSPFGLDCGDPEASIEGDTDPRPLHYAGDEQDIDTPLVQDMLGRNALKLRLLRSRRYLFLRPGSALDGWAREELSPSLAWSAATRMICSLLSSDSEVKTSGSGNVAERDNFVGIPNCLGRSNIVILRI